MSLNNRFTLATLAAMALAPCVGSGGIMGDRPRKLRQKGQDIYYQDNRDQFPAEFWQAAEDLAHKAIEADRVYRKDKALAKRNARPTNWKAARKELKKRHQQPRREKVKL